MFADVLLHLGHYLGAVVQRRVGPLVVEHHRRIAAQQLQGGKSILLALGYLQNVLHRPPYGPVDGRTEIVVQNLPGGLQGRGQGGFWVLALLQGQQYREVPQVHAGYTAGVVLGQGLGGHAGHTGAQGQQLVGGLFRHLQTAQRYHILRCVKVQIQLGALAVKPGAVGQ